MNDLSYLVGYPDRLVGLVKQYGPLGISFHNLDSMVFANIVSSAIMKLDQENLDLKTFHMKHHDDSIRSVEFQIFDLNPDMNIVRIDKVISYFFSDQTKIIHGSYVEREHAGTHVEFLNKTYGFVREDI